MANPNPLPLKPLFKYAGSKQKMLEAYAPYIHPQQPITRFVDLFAGGLTMTLWAAENYPDAKLVINDNNTELITLYTHLKTSPQKIINEYQKIVNHYLPLTIPDRKLYYYTLRDEYCQVPVKGNPIRLSALLLFMMQTSFNGLWKTYIKCNYRFSTPPGNCFEKAPFFSTEKIWNIVKVLTKAEIFNTDFDKVPLQEGDFLYADPPYRDSFVDYSNAFNDEAQIRLANLLTSHKGLYAYSNKDIHDGWYQKHFPNQNIHSFNVKYTAGRGENVVKVSEVLITNYAPKTV